MHKTLYILVLASLTLGQFMAVSKDNSLNIYLFDIVVAVAAYLQIWNLLYIKKTFILHKSFLAFFGFILIGAAALIVNSDTFNSHESFVALLYAIRYLAYFVYALSLFNAVRAGALSKDFILTGLIYSGIFIVIAGFIQLIFLPDFSTLDVTLGWDPHKNRLSSTFFDPNFVGAYLVLIFPLLLEKVRDAKRLGLFDAINIVILLSGIILTFSRSAWLFLAFSVLIYGLLKNRTMLLLALTLMFLAYYAVPRIQTRISGATDPADSAQYRIISWQNTIKIIRDAPIIGIGLDGLRYVQKDYGYLDEDTIDSHAAAGSDSSLLFVFATTGIIGLLLFLYGYLAPLVNKKLPLIYKIVLIGLLINSQFINALFYPQILIVWLIINSFSYL